MLSLSRFTTNISRGKEAMKSAVKKFGHQSQSKKEYVDTNALAKFKQRKEDFEENHPKWTNNPGSQEMADAGFGGRKRKKRRKKKRTKKKARRKRRKRSRTRRGGVMDDDDKEEYRQLTRDNPDAIIEGSNLPQASAPYGWKCPECHRANRGDNIYCISCGTAMPCNNYKNVADVQECKRYNMLKSRASRKSRLRKTQQRIDDDDGEDEKVHKYTERDAENKSTRRRMYDYLRSMRGRGKKRRKKKRTKKKARRKRRRRRSTKRGKGIFPGKTKKY